MKFHDYLNEKLKDPEFRKEWDDIQPEIEKVIEQAKTKYPASIQYRGFLTADQCGELEAMCDVRCGSLYMDGTAMYSIRYKKNKL